MQNDQHEKLKELGRGAYASIAEMVAALDVDYFLLDGLRDEREALLADIETAPDDEELAAAKKAFASWEEVDGAEYEELNAAAGDCKDEDEARERIQEDALSVEVRSDWHAPGSGDNTPTDFRICIRTGGPAVQIRGELDDDFEPRRAWLEVQDWGTPWVQYFDAEQDVLLAYARCFYFGE